MQHCKTMRAKARKCHLHVTAPEPLEEKCLLAADILINEIMYHQVGDNVGQEYIELFNAGDAPAELENWSFNAGVDFVFPAISLAPESYLVVAADVAEFNAAYPNVDNMVGGWTGRLANRGEGVRLVDDAGVQVDRVRYADEGDWATRMLGEDDNGHRGWRWLAPHDGDGKSLELINPNLSNDYGHNWTASVPSGGTPGAQNSAHSDNVAPLVIGLAHSPAIPRSSDAVTVSTQIVDEAAEATTAMLSYRADGEATFATVAMTRNDSTFTASIPAFGDGTVVEFFVTASDDSGNQRVVPTFESDDPTRTANRLYQVLDDVENTATWQPGSQPVSHLIMTEAERLALADIGDGPFLEASSRAQMNGTFIRVEGNSTDVRYNVGIRNRGGASRVGPPNNYRVNFPHDAEFNGVVSTNLNSRFTHAQAIGSAIYRLAGIPAADARISQVRVNGADLAEPGGPLMFGSYVELETITGSFPDRYFPEDRRGNLYRVIESGTETGDLRFEGTDPQAYQDTYSKRTNEEADDWTDLIDLVNVLNNTPDETFVEEVNRVLDVDQWMRYIALDSLLGNFETGLNVGTGDNFWLYRGTIDTRFKLIPHDLDTILGVGRTGQPNRSIFSYTDTIGLNRFLTHDELVPRYYQAFVDLMDQIYNPETLFPLMDRLIGHVTEFELADMKQFVVDRIAAVKNQLPDEFLVTSSLPIVDGYHRTTLPSAEIIGTANGIRAKSVLVNGQVADWSPRDREWSVTIAGEGTTESLINPGATWRYWDDGTDLGGAWRSRSFNDSSWQAGPSPLGYGEGDEATTVSFGENPSNKHITTYFRHAFDVADASEILDLSMRLERDDGAIVYLNNQEIARSNMPSGAVDFQTVASSWIGGGLEGQQLSFNVDPSLLVDGTNVIAVEVHQLTSIDDDLRFELTLDATVGTVTGGVPLNPGINRVNVASYDGPNGTGNIVDSGFIDVWYDGAAGVDDTLCNDTSEFGTLADSVIPASTLSSDTVLAPCGPAYRVTGDVVVPDGVTLTVLPGTTVFFEAGAGLTFNGGQLVAEGTEFAQIRFTRAPELVGSWNGIQFNESTADNRISHAILEHATTVDGLIGLTSSTLEVNTTVFDHADFLRILTIDSSLTIRNSTFTDMFDLGEAPATDNGSEHIKGSGILEGGQLVLEGNYFGRTTGHNDSVDFDGAELPGPIPIILNNVFAGSGDDALDLESDAYIEGNAFFNIVKDQFNTSTGDANAISAGAGRTYYVYRNTFHNVDHVAQVKDDAFMHYSHNTADTVHISPIYFDLEDRSPGMGADVDSSIFSNTPITFGAAEQAQQLTLNNSIATSDAVDLGQGNFIADPRLANPAEGDSSLLPGSPADGIGFGGMDIGGAVPAAAWIDGAPAALTGQRNASIEVGGPGLVAYRFRVNGAAWSEPTTQSQPILLEELADGTYQLDVIGQNVAGIWQDESSPTSIEWVVDTSRNHLFINEILASNDSVERFGGTPDLIELYNDGETEIDLSGMTITDDLGLPAKFVIPDGTSIASRGYLTLLATDTEGEGIRVGFRLSADGEGVYLFDAPANGGNLVDGVDFGIQITDLSISRIGRHRQWELSKPTFDQANDAVALGDSSSVRINEWLASADVRFSGDFLELFNTDDVPVSLAGLYLTDDPIGQPTRHEIAPLSFIDGHGYAVFDPNGNLENGANELPFGVSADGEHLALLDTQLQPIDQILLLAQTTDSAEGRLPDGSATIGHPPLATPENPNTIIQSETTVLLPFDAEWSYDQSGDDLGSAWRAVGFDDSAWNRGPGPLGVDDGELPVAISTPIELGVITHYFRSDFMVGAEILENPTAAFELTTEIDDGVIIYVNDSEVLRLGVRDGEVNFDTRANRSAPTAELEGPFVIPASLLQIGTNEIAAELHQVSAASPDAVFGVELSATTTSTDEASARAIAVRDGLRISELMYNPVDGSDAEFIELTNVSDMVLDLTDVRISGGVDAVLETGTLAPGEAVVLTPNASVFRSTYGSEPTIAGVYDGRLSNGGEEIIVNLPAPFDGPFDASALRFTYSDSWYPTTDGDGFSLEVVDVDASIRDWGRPEGWKPSGVPGGTPGSIPAEGGVPGDFNSDGLVDVADADALNAAIIAQSVDSLFDLNNDNVVDLADQNFLVEEILNTRPGDTNLDGDVDFADFLVLTANFGIGSPTPESLKWSQADFDADGAIDFADFLLLSAHFGFERMAEPQADMLAALAVLSSEDE